MATSIVITRPYATYGLGRKVKVFVDGKEAGGVQNQEELDVPVEPGAHSVYVSMDWAKSEPLEVTVEENTSPKFAIQTPDMLTSYVALVAYPKKFYKLIPA